MLSHELEVSLNLAVSEATRRGHSFVTVEHILYALLHNRESIEVLENCGCSIPGIRTDIEEFFGEHLTENNLEQGKLPVPTIGFQRVIQRAARQVQSSGGDVIKGPNILVAMFSEEDSFAVYFLTKQSLSKLDLLQYISHGIVKESSLKPAEFGELEELRATKESEVPPKKSQPKRDPLSHYADNLCERARQGAIDPLVGRAPEIERTMQILCRRRKNNPLLVGEAGVGKTAIAEGLAGLIVKGEVPEKLQNKEIYALDMGAMVAGSKFRGDFEQRLKDVLQSIKERKNCIVFIDEIHTIVGAGASGSGSMDASNLLKPALSSGELHCIGSTTFKEYRNIFQNDHALARRFQKIDVVEPSVEDTFKIVLGLKDRYELFHNVRYSEKALHAACELSAKHISDRKLPDKAIDVIDEVGAMQSLRAKPDAKPKLITVEMIQMTIAKMARIPAKNVSISDRSELKALADKLKSKVFGQDAAIDALSTAIKLSRSGLGDESKPIGSFLFSGPTGVGKTEVAKQLAEVLNIKLIRFDMSEYMERHSVSRLIGSPPGYVGFDQGGLLTDAIVKSPHAVLLLDEIEKAHPDMQNILLQVMDHGTLTDNNGREADFRNVILILTTNAGAQELSRSAIGFNRQFGEDKGLSQAVKNQFSPEFRNRLNGIIQFGPLDMAIVEKVTQKFIDAMNDQLAAKHVRIKVDAKAIQFLAKTGYDAAYGARPIARLIEDRIKKPLADELLFGQLAKGGEVKISLKDDELAFKYSLPPIKQKNR